MNQESRNKKVAGKPRAGGLEVSKNLATSRLPADIQHERRQIRLAVFARDRRCVIAELPSAGQCFGRMTVHHRRKASQGGAYTLENLVTACAHHNDELEADATLAAEARAAGYVVRRGDPGWAALGEQQDQDDQEDHEPD